MEMIIGKLLFTSSKEASRARELFILYLIFWIPISLLIISSIYYHVMWQYFGITDGISSFYLKFGSIWNSYLWVIQDIGWFGMILIGIESMGYFWLTRKIVISFIK